MSEFSSGWVWSGAGGVLARAERLDCGPFRPTRGTGVPPGNPPVDVLETEREVLVLVALPGVEPDEIETVIEGPHLVVTGHRVFPAELATAVIHRLELPQGRFERRIRLPGGQYGTVRRAAVHGCVLITLQKTGTVRG